MATAFCTTEIYMRPSRAVQLVLKSQDNKNIYKISNNPTE